jgi:hypothetical protein
MRGSPRDLLLLLSVDAIIYATALRNAWFLGELNRSDLPLPPTGWAQLSSYALNAWNFQNLGSPSGFAPVILLMGLLATLLRSPALAQKIVYFPSMPIASLTAYFLLSRMRVPSIPRVALSVLYPLSCWMAGEFLTGEPALVYLYALFPLVAYFMLKASRQPLSRLDFLVLSLVLAVAVSFTLQSLPVYVFASIPFLAEFAGRPRREVSRNLAYIVGAALVAIVANSYSLTPYLAAYAGASATPQNWVGSFLSPAALSLRPWLLAMGGAVAVLAYVALSLGLRDQLKFLLGSVVASAFFLALYFSVGSPLTQELILRVPLLAPYLNYDKFVLMEGLYLFLSLAAVAASFHVMPHRGRASPARDPVIMAAVAVAVGIFLASSFIPSYQPWPASTTVLLSGNLWWNHAQVPHEYYELREYLLSHGVGFGYSYHVLVVPEVPGNVVPFFIGQSIIPGYNWIMPNRVVSKLVNEINANASVNALELMALMGIKYVAVIPNTPSNWLYWNSTPGVAWWGQQEIFNGYWTYYLSTFMKWKQYLVPVYSKSNLTIFENTFTESPAVQIYDWNLLDGLVSGNDSCAYVVKPLSGNLIEHGSAPFGAGWGVWSNGGARNYSIINSSTVAVRYGSGGVGTTSSTIYLAPDTYYMFSVHVVKVSQDDVFPPNGFDTGGGVYWNRGTGSNVTGAAVVVAPPGNFTGTVSDVFRTPSYNGEIPAVVVLYASPPLRAGEINYVRFNVSLIPVNATPVALTLNWLNVSSSGTRIFVSGVVPSNTSSYVVLDTGYSPQWRLEAENGQVVYPLETPMGTLAFNVTGISGSEFVLYYSGQTIYDHILIISILTYISLIISLLLLLMYGKMRMRHAD